MAKLLNPATGWFAGWVSADGVMHDYGYTFVNGMAVAYGLVSPADDRRHHGSTADVPQAQQKGAVCR